MTYLMYQHPKGGQITICSEGSQTQICAINHGKILVGTMETDLNCPQIMAGFNFESRVRLTRLEGMYSDVVCAVARADGNKHLEKEQRKRSFEARKNYNWLLHGGRNKDIEKEGESNVTR